MGAFDIDPWEAAKLIYERRAMQLVAKVMKKCGVMQVDISDVDLAADDELEIAHDHNGFLRIRGHFQLENAAPQVPVTARSGEDLIDKHT